MRKPCNDVDEKSQSNHLNDRYKPALPSIFQKEEGAVVSNNEEVKMPMIHSAASNFPISCHCGSSGDGNAKSEVQEFIQ
jgi:hypothetical protein